MSGLMIRKISNHELMMLTSLAVLKGFKSREAYVRHLISIALKEDVQLNSNHRYFDLIQQLLQLIEIQHDVINENTHVMKQLLKMTDLPVK